MRRTTDREWDKIIAQHDYKERKKNRSNNMNQSKPLKKEQPLNHLIAMNPTIPISNEPFSDHLEHLQELEREATLLLLALASQKPQGPAVAHSLSLKDDSVAADELSLQPVSYETLVKDYQKCRLANLSRETTTLSTGKQLTFVELCQNYNLDEKERTFALFLLLQATAPRFRKLLEESGLDENNRHNQDGLTVGFLLELTCREYREQLEARRYFSVDGTMIRKDLIEFDSRMDEGTNILSSRVRLQDSCIRFCLGDNNLYNTTFKFVRREMGTINLAKVVLPNQTKQEVTQRLETFYRLRSSEQAAKLDSFYGYGTGLALLFHGPSGTGKTMLAQALSHHFQRPLFYMTEENLHNMPGGYDDIFQTIFREANLHGGIVFFDEADDLFREGTTISRELLIALEKSHCVTILATNKPIEMDPAMERRLSMKVAFEKPDAAMRKTIWQALLPDFISLAEDIDITQLAEEFQFSGGLIKNTLVMAISNTYQESIDSPCLTHDHLVSAAQLQIQQVIKQDSLIVTPQQIKLESLPLAEKDQRHFNGLEKICTEAHQQDTPLRFLLQSSTEIGCDAAVALAFKCGLKARVIDLSTLLGQQADGKVTDPVTQKEVDPFDVVFSTHCREDALLIFNDPLQIAQYIFQKNQDDDSSLESEFAHRLKQFSGLCCLVTGDQLEDKATKIFDFSIALGHPEIARQLAAWKDVLPAKFLDDERLLDIVERHPMHLDEIEVVSRRARYLSYLHDNNSSYGPAHLQTALNNYNYTGRAPVLFGGNHE